MVVIYNFNTSPALSVGLFRFIATMIAKYEQIIALLNQHQLTDSVKLNTLAQGVKEVSLAGASNPGHWYRQDKLEHLKEDVECARQAADLLEDLAAILFD